MKSNLCVAFACCAAIAAAQVPSNNECTGALAIYPGVNPSPPFGSTATYTNVGATLSAGWSDEATCAGGPGYFTRDVFFSYTAGAGGPTTIATCTPPGFTEASSNDTLLAVYDSTACPGGGPALACDDQGCGNLSTVTFDALLGETYYVRVGTWASTTTPGAFRVVVTPPSTPVNDDCANATPFPPFDGVAAVSASGTSAGAHQGLEPGVPFIPGPFGPIDVWFSFQVPQAGLVTVASTNAFTMNEFEIYSGVCGNLSFVAGNTFVLSDVPVTPTSPADTFYVRALRSPGQNLGAFTLNLSFRPQNDDPAGAIPLAIGINPAPPAGNPAAFYANYGATDSASIGGQPVRSVDTFFTFVPTTPGRTRISLCDAPTPADLSFDTLLLVFDGATLVAENDDVCGFAPEVQFDAVAGRTYLVQVAALCCGSLGRFRVTVEELFRLVIDSPTGAGSLRIRNLLGAPGAFHLTVLTVAPGAYPNGWLFGLDPSIADVYVQLAAGAPFTGVLDGNGSTLFALNGALPPLTLYGVSLLFGGAGFITASGPTSHTLP